MHHSKHQLIVLLTILPLMALGLRAQPMMTQKILCVQEVQVPGIIDGEVSCVTCMGLPFSRKPVYSGEIYADGQGGITFKFPLWMDFYDFSSGPLYVELLSEAQLGEIIPISSADLLGKTLLLAEVLVEGSYEARVVPFHTINSVFSDYNRYGFKPGATLEEADELIFLDSEAQSVTSYFYSSEKASWVSCTAPDVAAGDRVIYPDEALLVRRKDFYNITLPFTGYADYKPKAIWLNPGLNLVGNSISTSEDRMGFCGLAQTEDASESVVSGELEGYRWKNEKLKIKTLPISSLKSVLGLKKGERICDGNRSGLIFWQQEAGVIR